jgi:hypothetical protein
LKSPSTKIPVIFSGTRTEVDDFVSRYNMNATSSQVVGANNIYIDRHIVKATISNQDFERLINDINVKDLYLLRKTITGSLSLQPGSLIRHKKVNKFHHTLKTLCVMEFSRS